MKRYIPIILIFVFFLSVIFFYLMRNVEIKKEIDKLSEIRNVAYELEILSHKQQQKFKLLGIGSTYDGIVEENKAFEQRFTYFATIIKDTQNTKLENLLYDMNQKKFLLKNIYEDLKTDHAVIKNSQMWLSKSYRSYVSSTQSELLSKDLLMHIFNVISPDSNIKHITFTKLESQVFEVDKFNAHLQIIFEKKRSLESLEHNLQKYSLLNELERVVLYSIREVHKLQEEIEFIIMVLVMSSGFLLLFGVFVYIREVLSTKETKRLKNELQQFVDALNETNIVSKTDLKGTITYVNNKFCEISGYTQEELLGSSHSVVKHPQMDKNVYKELWNTITDKRIFRGVLQNKTKHGDSYFVDTVIIPIEDENGNVSEYMAVRYNVTDLVNGRDAAILAEKAKGEFLSNMSHELRTPLNSINGFSSILKRSIKDAKQLSYLNNITESSDNLIGLINDILDLSKLQSGNFSLDYYDFNVKDKMNLLLERFMILVEKSNLTLHSSIDIDDNLILHGDWLRISQVITNLLSNAIKFTPASKSIDFSIEYRKDMLVVCIEDQGIGLSKEAQEKIFKPFMQADSSTTRKYGGTGLGLSIVMNLVEQMKGRVNVQSTEGKGSTFKVTLPLKKVEISLDESQTAIDEDVFEALHGKVLIAEDNKTNQMLISILMQEFGVDYTLASDGVEAVECFGKEKFDAVLMDENMPNMNGIEAMKKIHSLYGKDTPIIALTANSMSGDKEKFLAVGMDAYVAKPIDDKVVYSVLKKILPKR